jgi:hypothetical protein
MLNIFNAFEIIFANSQLRGQKRIAIYYPHQDNYSLMLGAEDKKSKFVYPYQPRLLGPMSSHHLPTLLYASGIHQKQGIDLPSQAIRNQFHI